MKVNMEKLMKILIDWYKRNHYAQGDDYNVNYSPGADLWIISHSNDYPMQHGKGDHVRLRTADVEEIINQEREKDEKWII